MKILLLAVLALGVHGCQKQHKIERTELCSSWEHDGEAQWITNETDRTLTIYAESGKTINGASTWVLVPHGKVMVFFRDNKWFAVDWTHEEGVNKL
jgi:hypothetical protein